jgi:hypothetical protein
MQTKTKLFAQLSVAMLAAGCGGADLPVEEQSNLATRVDAARAYSYEDVYYNGPDFAYVVGRTYPSPFWVPCFVPSSILGQGDVPFPLVSRPHGQFQRLQNSVSPTGAVSYASTLSLPPRRAQANTFNH